MQYLIKEGHHYSNHGIKLHFGITRKKFSFLFSPSCLYSTTSPGKDNLSINKLFGWSYGWHHSSSVRVGWRPDAQGKIDLFFYCYSKGQRFVKHFETVDVSEEYDMNITFVQDVVCFELNKTNNPLEISRKTAKFIWPWFRWGYYLWFYFGGTGPAPQDMTAYIFK